MGAVIKYHKVIPEDNPKKVFFERNQKERGGVTFFYQFY